MKPIILFILIFMLISNRPLLAFEKIVLTDPSGDDKGTGKYVYPTDKVYTKGSFDLLKLEVIDAGKEIEIKVTINSRIEDPWNSKSWGGNGFSLQFIQIYVDTDHKARSGHENALPGLNVKFDPNSWWEKCILISPQGTTRLASEINEKAAGFKKDIIIPKMTKAQGSIFSVIIPKSELGEVKKDWGWQVLMQSNEGYPDKKDLLTRKVNEYEGQHRFGGGTDFDCDPHAIDIFMPPAKGTDAEKEAQYKSLGAYKCGSSQKDWVHAKIPMVYPGK